MNIYNLTGKSVGSVELSPVVFGIEPNKRVVHEVLVAELAEARQGSASTKSRGEVRGGGRKPRPQKGTGAARQGSIRAPQWVGGGVVHGPHPRDFSKKVNKKVRKLALKSVLSAKNQEGKIVVLTDYSMDTPKTKKVIDFISNMKLMKPLFVLNDIFDEKSENLYYSARNVKNSNVIDVLEMAIYWILKHDNIVVTEDALKKIEEVLG